MPASQNRVSWVDYAKGICIVLVVLMHSTLGVENAAGGLSWLHDFIHWAKPFRMPDFFLISGLFRPAPVAQMDRALPSEGRGHRFESCRVRQ